MSVHLIRLRAGWLLEDVAATGPTRPAERVSLPLAWPPGAGPRVRLVRHFQAPPIDGRCESLGLQLEEVPGLVLVSLNGRELARPGPGTGTLHLQLAAGSWVPRGNRLVLEVEPGCAAGPDRAWGSVALTIRAREPGRSNLGR